MRRMLDIPFPPPSWPQYIHLTGLTSEASRQVHDLLLLAYQNGGGSVAPHAEWWHSLLTDSEFDPSLCFLAWDREGLVGIAQCWSSAFIKDLAVHPRRRGEGIGKSLLLHTFDIFKTRGASAVDLKVQTNNVAAIRLYAQMGMQPAG